MRGFYKLAVVIGFAVFAVFLLSSKASAATYTVINTNDAGAGSFRQAIIDANTNPGADTIDFNIPGAGVHTITPSSKYPDIVESLTIDALTQPGATCGTLVPATLPAASNTPHNLLVELNAINMTDGSIDQQSALRFAGTDASNSAVRGLVINQTFDSVYGAIMMRGDAGEDIQNLTVECNYLGTAPTGTSIPGGTYGSAGVWNLDNGGPSTNLTVQNNLISGVVFGVYSRSTGTIQNNVFCTDVTTTIALGNCYTGPFMEAAFYYPATTTAEHNIVGGANDVGISQNGAENVIINDNYVGVDITGTASVPNGSGINLGFGASTVTNNLVAGNNGNGVWAYQIVNGQVDINNNRIGVDVNGNPLGNGNNGIELVLFTASSNTININSNNISNNLGTAGIWSSQSSSQSGMRVFDNNISSNLNDGIGIGYHDVEIDNNQIQGNGTAGIGVGSANPNNLNVHNNNISNNIDIGVNTTGNNHIYDTNTINNNGGSGLESYATGIQVTNNTANNNSGVGIHAGSNGGNGVITNNTTSNNSGSGLSVAIDSGNVNSNVSSNNGTNGIELFGGAGFGFTVSNNQTYSNTQHGMSVSGSTVTIAGNFVGVDNANNPVGNGGDGIFVSNADGLTIGGNNPTSKNQIASNAQSGVHIYGCQNLLSWNNIVIGNNIGVNSAGNVTPGYGNGGSGVQINEQFLLGCGGGGGGGSIYKNIVGSDNTSEQNIIAGNAEDGIRIYQSDQTDVFSNAILPNKIFENGNLGINLAADSINSGNANIDLGPNALNNYIMTLPTIYANNYFNHPEVTATPYIGNQLTVEYNYSPNQVDNSTLSESDVVGYRLDFYLNDNTQDGAYTNYSQGKIYLGSFIVNGPENNATHTFTSPVPLNDNMSVNATATILWAAKPAPSCNPPIDTGPPYRGGCT